MSDPWLSKLLAAVQSEGQQIVTSVSLVDGKVTAVECQDFEREFLPSLPLARLRELRDKVNEAIYDKERGK